MVKCSCGSEISRSSFGDRNRRWCGPCRTKIAARIVSAAMAGRLPAEWMIRDGQADDRQTVHACVDHSGIVRIVSAVQIGGAIAGTHDGIRDGASSGRTVLHQREWCIPSKGRPTPFGVTRH